MAKTKEKTMPAAVTTTALLQVKKEANTLSTRVEELKVESAEDVTTAADFLQNIKKAIARIEEEQGKVVKRLQELVKIEKARWKPSLDLLNAADKKVRAQILEYRQLEQAAAKKAEEKILQRVATGKLKETTAMVKLEAVQTSTMGKSVSSESATASFRTLKKLSIVDPMKIPRGYLVANEKLIFDTLKAGGVVPGCVIVEEETLAIK
jgi:Siphovirus Gp157.